LSLRDVILTHTKVARARLCPEISLHLITAECPLFRGNEEDAARAGLVDPYWAFSWAGGQALARYVLDRPETVRDRRILDFGAGGGVEGLAAALAGARSVLCADIDPMAAESALANAELCGVRVAVTTDNLIGHIEPAWDVVLAGDVFYGTEMAGPTIGWLRALARSGALVLIGDPDRGFLDTTGLEELARYEAPADNDHDGSFLRPTSVYRVVP